MVSKLYQDNSGWQPREGSKEEEKKKIYFFWREREGGKCQADSLVDSAGV